MTEIADHYRTIAAAFTAKVDQVPAGAWDNPAPCEGWVARDVIGHLVEWAPAFFFDRWGISQPAFPSIADDPAGAWKLLDTTIEAALDDPSIATKTEDTPLGPKTFEEAIDMIFTGDVFLHTWDLARATGLDETLDPVEVHHALVDMLPMDDALRGSGHFGPKVEVPDDADEQTRLIAFIGRTP